MFRFATALALFGLFTAVNADGESCADPVVLEPFNAVTMGNSFSFQFQGRGPEWFKLEVEDACRVGFKMDNCQSASGEMTITVFRGCPGTPGYEVVAEDTGSCATSGGVEIINQVDFEPGNEYFLQLTTDIEDFDGDVAILGTVTGATVCGDPHFNRWTIPQRDSFHGECDLVLLHQEEVADEVDVDVHVRTTIVDSYSYVSGVAVKAGEHALEFDHTAFYLDGELKTDDDLPVDFGNGKIVKVEEPKQGKKAWNVYIADQMALTVFATKHFMGVDLKQTRALDGSVGILGDHKTGDMVARDGRIMDNFEDFAFEWQVAPSDPKIFMQAREPQLPYERCRMPAVSVSSRRRLRGVESKLYDQAVEACAHQIPANVQSCIDDVVFTGELDLARL